MTTPTDKAIANARDLVTEAGADRCPHCHGVDPAHWTVDQFGECDCQDDDTEGQDA